MSKPNLTVLVIGSNGSVGRHVVAESIRQGHVTRALVRDLSRAQELDRNAQVIVADITDAKSLRPALDGVDAVVFTHGGGNAEAVDYGAVRNVITVLDGRRLRIALMTAIGVTGRSTGHDWKRRGERLVRASGNAYTIVRPGWFDYNTEDQLEVTMLQGDTRRAGSPADGSIARRQIARVLVAALTCDDADHRTFELVAEHGPEQHDLGPLFAALEPDTTIDGVHDQPNLPLEAEPPNVCKELETLLSSR